MKLMNAAVAIVVAVVVDEVLVAVVLAAVADAVDAAVVIAAVMAADAAVIKSSISIDYRAFSANDWQLKSESVMF
jgi:hypothetical protein